MYLHYTMTDRDIIRAARASSSHIVQTMADRLETRVHQIDRVRERLKHEPDNPLKRDILQTIEP